MPRSGMAPLAGAGGGSPSSRSELHKNFKPFFSPDADGNAPSGSPRHAGPAVRRGRARCSDGRDFLVGDEISVADCYLFVMLNWARDKAGVDLPAALIAYHDRLKARPAVAKALAAEGLG